MNTEAFCLPYRDAFEVANQTSGYASPAQWLVDWATGGQKNDAGVTVNGYTALTHCPLWQGVNIIAGDIGQVPIRLVRNEFFDQRRHPAWNLLRVRPNDLQTPSVFKETMMQWAIVWGNFVGLIEREGSRPAGIIPLRPDCVWHEVVRFDFGQLVIYHYHSPYSGATYKFLPDDIFHIQGLTGDGIWGYPLHEIAKNCIGHGLALEKHGNRQFSNGARPSGVLKHPGKLTPEAQANLRREWNNIHEGPDKAGRIAVLAEAMEFQAMQMTNIDAQWIEAKKLNRVDSASLLFLPAHKLNALEDSSVRSNLEEQNETYKQMTLTRPANRIDEECRRKLLTIEEWLSDEFRFVFDWDTFLRADVDTRSTVADRLVKATIWNPNEGRHFMGYAPREGGDEYGNPAINPNEEKPKPGAESGEDEPENDELEAENAHRALLLDRIQHLLDAECHRLTEAAGSPKNFATWLTEFYCGDEAKFLTLAASIAEASLTACKSVGLDACGWQNTLKSYAHTRFACLNEINNSVSPRELRIAIDKLIASTNGHLPNDFLRSALGGNNGTENN